MASPYSIVTIVGSLRKESFSLKIANALAKLAPGTLKLDVTMLNDISYFNQDLEAAPPEEIAIFKDAIRASDAIVFSSPEYNYSIPGHLKNAIDWASRPYGMSAWDGKPALIMGASPGAVGTARGC